MPRFSNPTLLKSRASTPHDTKEVRLTTGCTGSRRTYPKRAILESKRLRDLFVLEQPCQQWRGFVLAPAICFTFRRAPQIGRQLSRPRSAMRRPNSKPHFVVARRTTVDADMRVASFRQCVDACDVHFFPTPTLRQFSAAGHQQVFKYRHVASLKGFYVTQRKNLTFVQTLVASRVKSRVRMNGVWATFCRCQTHLMRADRGGIDRVHPFWRPQ